MGKCCRVLLARCKIIGCNIKLLFLSAFGISNVNCLVHGNGYRLGCGYGYGVEFGYGCIVCSLFPLPVPQLLLLFVAVAFYANVRYVLLTKRIKRLHKSVQQPSIQPAEESGSALGLSWSWSLPPSSNRARMPYPYHRCSHSHMATAKHLGWRGTLGNRIGNSNKRITKLSWNMNIKWMLLNHIFKTIYGN